ncbi:MAG: pyroglutamyl-peptidase I, partial [Clostridia bacterium]|nr:pyroglutamyl-peptidase I [Clostridia bacterium]
ASLPVPRIVGRLTEKKIPAAVSFTAGAYVCNSLMYAALRLTEARGIPAGFIHLPLSSEIALEEGKASRTISLPQSSLTAGIAEAIAAVAAALAEG